jgi:hypothetical protein
MRSHVLLVTLSVIGWLIVAFAIPGIVAGIFFVLGTVVPWYLVVPVLVATFGWLLTRLDFNEQRWRMTAGWLVLGWALTAIFTILLLVTRNNSLSLVVWGLPPAIVIGAGGLLLMLTGPKKRQLTRREEFLARISSERN